MIKLWMMKDICIALAHQMIYTGSYARDRLEDEDKMCILVGSYNNGGAVGVQYEFKR